MDEKEKFSTIGSHRHSHNDVPTDVPTDGFTHIDSRGAEGSTQATLPGVEDEEELEDAVECMPFWEALQLCIEETYTIARLAWEDKYMVWNVATGDDIVGTTLATTSLADVCMGYTPTQEDMFADDWLVEDSP